MKAMLLRRIAPIDFSPLEWVDLPIPEPGPGEVRIRAGELVLPALESLNKGGTLSLAGIYMTPIPQMDYERYVFYERDIHSVTCNTRQDGRELLAEAAAIPIRPHTTIYPLIPSPTPTGRSRT